MYKAIPHSVSVHTRINKTLLHKVDQETVNKSTTRAQVVDAALRKYYGAAKRKAASTKAKK